MCALLRDYAGFAELKDVLEDLSTLSGLPLTLTDTDGETCANTPGCQPAERSNATVAHQMAVGRGERVTLLTTVEGESDREQFGACARTMETAVRNCVVTEGLCEEVCARFEEINLFYEMAGHTIEQRDPSAVGTSILQHLLQIVGARRGSILVAGAQPDEMEVVAAVGGPHPLSLVGKHVKRSETLCGQVLRTGEALVVQDAQEFLGSNSHPDRQYLGDSFVCLPVASLPLKVGQDMLGVINVTDKTTTTPFSTGDVKLIQAVAAQTSLLVQTARLLQKNRGLLMNFARSLSYAIDAKDPYTHGHSLRVTEHALGMARALRLPEGEVQGLEIAGLLHDIGKIGIPEHILNKNGSLTEEEYAVVKQHPDAGSRILRDITEMSDIVLYMRHHHERYDGGGYPDGLRGEQVPLPARILAVADAYDAITSTRPYRGASSRPKALAELKRNAGTQFDPKLADLFVHLYGTGKRKRSVPPLEKKYPGLAGIARVASEG